MDQKQSADEHSKDLTGTVEDGPELRVRYWPTRDMTFMEQPGWSSRENYNVALGIVAEMRHNMGMPE